MKATTTQTTAAAATILALDLGKYKNIRKGCLTPVLLPETCPEPSLAGKRKNHEWRLAEDKRSG